MRAGPVVVALLAAALVAGTAVPAQAATGPLGADVSWPQCDAAGATGSAFPADAAFGVVGINGGRPIDPNTCVSAQLAWASSLTARPDVYVNTADPWPEEAAWWPKGDRTRSGRTVHSPYGSCKRTANRSRQCAWVYGASLAQDDLAIPGATAGATGTWWLDVEYGADARSSNTWRGGAVRNRAVLEGMASALGAAGAKVGLYAQGDRFHEAIGAVPASSVLAAAPTWFAGAADRPAAARRCSGTPLAGGRVALVQYVDAATGFDRDLRCLNLTVKPTPKVTGAHVVGRTVTARAGTWKPGNVHLAYRWNRDGAPIRNAVQRAYTLQRADAGHRITVTVTGTENGYSRAARTSAAFRASR